MNVRRFAQDVAMDAKYIGRRVFSFFLPLFFVRSVVGKRSALRRHYFSKEPAVWLSLQLAIRLAAQPLLRAFALF
jgi:hypothetical protein